MEAKGGGLGGEFAECRNPSCAHREPELAELVEHGGVGESCPGLRPGNRQVLVVRPACPVCQSRSPAKGSGTGEGGSPRCRRSGLPKRMAGRSSLGM
jgi:hypothetical protein